MKMGKQISVGLVRSYKSKLIAMPSICFATEIAVKSSKMIYLVSVWAAVSAVTLVRCDISDDNYNIISTMLKSPLRTGSGIHKDVNLDSINANRLNQLEDDYIDPINEDVTESSSVKKEVDASIETDESDTPTSTATPETSEETPRASESDNSLIREGFRHFRSLYDECNRKINRRINKLLRTNVEAKSNAEKDLFQLKEYVLSLYRCLKVSGFRYLDEVLMGDIIPVSDYVDFVREKRDLGNSTIVNVIPTILNGKLSIPSENQNQTVSGYVSDILRRDWSDLLWQRLARLLRSHSLKFRIDQAAMSEGRGRRRDHRMFAMMVMGFMIMSTILIPMGFQFLTVLGGKSLLMAKMALIMSAINGLKKIATSQVGYGFYHTAPGDYHHDHHHHGFHEKVFQVKPDENQLPFRLAI